MSAALRSIPRPAPHAPTFAVEAVTPEIARRWLAECNVHNRSIRDDVVDAYARDMSSGAWQLTGEAIKFGLDGSLLDGQHRLAAIVKSGRPIKMTVVRGIAASSQFVMDTGAKRTASDAIALNGGANVVVTAASARIALLVNAVECGELSPSRIDRGTVTTSEVLAFIDTNPDIVESAAFASKLARRTDIPPAMVAYSHWRFTRINPAAADAFWIAAADKVGLSSGDPVIALTNRFAEARRNREKLTRSVQMSLIFRAWNARRSHKTMRFIRVNSPAGGLVSIPEPK